MIGDRVLQRHLCCPATVQPPPPPGPAEELSVQEERAPEIATLTTGVTPEATSTPLTTPSPYLEIEAPRDDDIDDAIDVAIGLLSVSNKQSGRRIGILKLPVATAMRPAAKER